MPIKTSMCAAVADMVWGTLALCLWEKGERGRSNYVEQIWGTAQAWGSQVRTRYRETAKQTLFLPLCGKSGLSFWEMKELGATVCSWKYIASKHDTFFLSPLRSPCLWQVHGGRLQVSPGAKFRHCVSQILLDGAIVMLIWEITYDQTIWVFLVLALSPTFSLCRLLWSILVAITAVILDKDPNGKWLVLRTFTHKYTHPSTSTLGKTLLTYSPLLVLATY